MRRGCNGRATWWPGRSSDETKEITPTGPRKSGSAREEEEERRKLSTLERSEAKKKEDSEQQEQADAAGPAGEAQQQLLHRSTASPPLSASSLVTLTATAVPRPPPPVDRIASLESQESISSSCCPQRPFSPTGAAVNDERVRLGNFSSPQVHPPRGGADSARQVHCRAGAGAGNLEAWKRTQANFALQLATAGEPPSNSEFRNAGPSPPAWNASEAARGSNRRALFRF